MKRQDKYPETDTFHFYNANPHNRITGDCSIRAICTALEQEYNDTLMEMAALACKTGFALDDTKGIEKYMASKGWNKMPMPKKQDGTKYTVQDFCKKVAKPGKRYVVVMAGHVVAVVDCKAWDIWDCTRPDLTKCVGNYYEA